MRDLHFSENKYIISLKLYPLKPYAEYYPYI